MSTQPTLLEPESTERPWWKDITPYMWVVLIIACLGWIFDVYEGQIFVASMNEAMPSLLPADQQDLVSTYNGAAFGTFLLGGALGGVLFGMLSDRIGRTKTMMLTILMYACFTGLTAFVQAPWQMVVLRFFVAMGVGGEWAVASAMVAEVMPTRARARLLGVFHASSVFGTYLAVMSGWWIIGNQNLRTENFPDLNWRLGFLVGVLPALLTVWIRLQLKEPDSWVRAREKAKEDETQKSGVLGDLFTRQHIRGTLVGVTLAAVGLATFWGVHIYGKDVMRATEQRPYTEVLPDYLVDAEQDRPTPKRAVLNGDMDELVDLVPGDGDRQQKIQTLQAALSDVQRPEDFQPPEDAGAEQQIEALLGAKFESIKSAEMLGMFLNTTGGGLGLVLFGFFAERFGRRGTFRMYHIGAVISVVGLFWLMPLADMWVYCIVLPIFGFLTLGMHAGYAVYFPELFPTRLRGTGGGFCFNIGRVIAAPMLFLGGWLQGWIGFEDAMVLLSVLYLIGVGVLFFAPETKGKELPE